VRRLWAVTRASRAGRLFPAAALPKFPGITWLGNSSRARAAAARESTRHGTLASFNDGRAESALRPLPQFQIGPQRLQSPLASFHSSPRRVTATISKSRRAAGSLVDMNLTSPSYSSPTRRLASSWHLASITLKPPSSRLLPEPVSSSQAD
jgi:hypothetical protein